LITEGYRAVQEIQTQARDGNLFDYFLREARSYRARKSRTREIAERTDYLGKRADCARSRAAVRRATPGNSKPAGVQVHRRLLSVSPS